MSDELIGTVKMFAGDYAPEGWALCDGRLLRLVENHVLFSIIGNSFGGDYRNDTFALPDLRGRFPIHGGQSDGLSNHHIGEIGGQEPRIIPTEIVQVSVPGNNHGAVKLRVINEEPTVSSMLPYVAINFIIAIRGIYPTRW